MGKGLWHIIEIIVRLFLTLIYRIFHKELTQEALDSFLQFVKFGMIGVTNTLLSYLLYALSMLIFDQAGWHAKFDYVAANGIAFVLSVLWSWAWNSHLVFRKRDGEHRVWWKTLLRTYIAYAFTGVFLNNVLSWLWIDVIRGPKMLAPALYLTLGVPVNFFMNKLWAYGRNA